MGRVVRPGLLGLGRVWPSHVGLGGWTARPGIVGGRDKLCAVQNLLHFSLQRSGFLIQCLSCLCVFAPHFCVFAPLLCVFVPSVCLRRSVY